MLLVFFVVIDVFFSVFKSVVFLWLIWFIIVIIGGFGKRENLLKGK